MALSGINVVELAGISPAPFCGMILADFGASVIRVDRCQNTGIWTEDTLARGKRSIAINLKDPKGQEIVQKLTSKADVIIEPFRPGVMERLNLGPEVLMAKNPGLIYARLTGYGQTGPHANKAGHDLNFVAMSGMLSMLGRKNEKPTFPANLLADFGGGGLTCALGILLSLFERTKSGKGQLVDSSMVEGTSYMSSFIFTTQHLAYWGRPRGENWLDTGAHFYDTYETKDGKYMAVGSLEPQFYAELLRGLEISADEGLKLTDQFSNYEDGKRKISEAFLTKTQEEWVKIFDKIDACVTPVLEMEEAAKHPLSNARNAFVKNEARGCWEPQPAPRLSRTPGQVSEPRNPNVGEHTLEILKDLGFGVDDISTLVKEEVVISNNMK